MFMENIFSHEGQVGHEVLAIFHVDFPAGSFASERRISFDEDNGTPCFAEWFALDALDLPGATQLYPAGLKAFLLK